MLAMKQFAPPAHAITRYNSTSMSCEEVRATIRRDGAAIMRYRSPRNPSLQLYGRYVRDDRFCQQEEAAETVFHSFRRSQILPGSMNARQSISTMISQF